MNETRQLIEDTAERIFRDHCTKDVVDAAEAGTWPQELWALLEGSGLTLAAVPESLGGSGGTIGDSMAVLRHAGRHAAPLPLAETFLAGCLLSEARVQVPSGPLTLAVGSSGNAPDFNQGTNGKTTLTGTLDGVAWASDASHIVVYVPGDGSGKIAILNSSDFQVTPAVNLAGEPRDTVSFEDVSISTERIVRVPNSVTPDRVAQLGALCRAVQMAGALERILELTVEHANVRVQFGRSIGSFQAVRQQIAVMAGEIAAASKAAEVAVNAVESGPREIEVAVAKARVGEAAGIVSEIAHQVHGAIGITHEHALHHFTRRLWSWRDEFGKENEWQERLGRVIAQAGADSLWQFVTDS